MPGSRSSSWLAAALMRLSRQLPIAERTRISRSAEGRSWPSSRTPRPSVRIIHVGARQFRNPSDAVALAPKLDAGSGRLDVLSVEQETTVKKPAHAVGQNAYVRDPGRVPDPRLAGSCRGCATLVPMAGSGR